MKFSTKKTLKNKKGFASLEVTILLMLFVSLIYYSFGFFGIVHTAVLHSIHARTYAFETFRHRTNLMYFRSNNRDTTLHYYNIMTRLHGINTDTGEQGTQIGTERPISMGLQVEESGRRQSVHNNEIFERVPASGRNSSVAVNPVWVMVLYGICLNSSCGGG